MSLFSVLVNCYGDYSDLHRRCLWSVMDSVRSDIPVLVGLSQASDATGELVYQMFKAGKVQAVVASQTNRNKCPQQRTLLDMVETPYVLWLDDDSWVEPKSDWVTVLEQFIRDNTNMDAAGKLGNMRRDRAESPWPEYRRFVETRRWYQYREFDGTEPAKRGQDFVVFPTGGCYLLRTAFVREHNFPDRAMVKKMEDVLLGELLFQQNGVLVPFPQNFLVHISEALRRGSGEALSDFRMIDPVTGEQQ